MFVADALEELDDDAHFRHECVVEVYGTVVGEHLLVVVDYLALLQL